MIFLFFHIYVELCLPIRKKMRNPIIFLNICFLGQLTRRKKKARREEKNNKGAIHI
jgi:hypothetical protein